MSVPEPRAALHEESAEQDVPGFRKKRDLCREVLLADSGIYHVAHYTSGVLDFALDLLAHGPAPGRDGDELAEHRDNHRRVGAQLVYRATELNRRLWELQTGALIRLVAQTATGLVFCNSVVGSEHVVGFGAAPAVTGAAPPAPAGVGAMPADPTQFETIDRAASGLATDLRRLMRQRSQNPGGWLTDTTRPGQQAIDGTVHPRVTGSADPDGVLAAALRPEGLHYLSHHRAGEQVASADILAHPELAPFFNRGVTVADRRSRYQRLAADLSLLVLQISRDLRRAVDGDVARLVLDVEMGAVYYSRLTTGDYLFGVTLDQDRVSQADHALWTAARRLVEPAAGPSGR
ncbi:hypothetical protein O7602_25830 [Micromonospora sp. WMMD1128]|uniref:hypothetical protein n=1 Tax=unclassified Micromonospora TaxID=2617518 RepID=UPI00248AD1BA|nr:MULTISPECIES: hypothetical protein [unclassified Micromonospora]WBB73073.1 hypothetical protein O7602_25830 [Micromonospora sp. WMMD1128]WFE33474.1 hypothetical protein O7613_28805 [Micromonospora sp. WMMD975]